LRVRSISCTGSSHASTNSDG
jgi:hypothetical protein